MLTKYFHCFQVFHKISPDLEIEETVMLLTPDIPFYDLPGPEVKVLDKPLSRQILGKDSGTIYGELEWTLDIHVGKPRHRALEK